MTPLSRREYLTEIHGRYRRARRAEKRRILDEFCRVCGYHRKYAIRLLNAPAPESKKRIPRKRRATYGPEVVSVLAAVWDAAGYPWSVRLKAILRQWRPWIEKHFHPRPEVVRKLLAISPATIDRCLRKRRHARRHRLYGRTKPGRLLKHQIPIKTDHWDVTQPGFTEIDLVAHCGNSASGDFLHSLNLTDIHTGWTEARAVMGKGETGVVDALDEMRKTLPFPLRGIDSDNGSEFLNHHLVRYCNTRPKVAFTRSRAYKKDDNAHIEQKNWTNVRKLLGWDRYDTAAAQEAINDLYRTEWSQFTNLFQPSVKLLKKVRVGARLHRVYDAPQTPLERLLASKNGERERIAKLVALRERLDPFALAEVIERKIVRVFRLANHRQSPRVAPAETGRKVA